jgi:hypothetical protein
MLRESHSATNRNLEESYNVGEKAKTSIDKKTSSIDIRDRETASHPRTQAFASFFGSRNLEVRDSRVLWRHHPSRLGFNRDFRRADSGFSPHQPGAS